MNIIARLFFATVGILGLYVGVVAFDEVLSKGQALMVAATFPGALLPLSLALYKKELHNEIVLFTVLCAGAFLFLLSLGMWHQTGEVAYLVFAALGCFLFLGVIALALRSSFKRSPA